jgi:hypothetical protein
VTPVMLPLNDTKSSDMEIVLGTSNLNPLSEIEIRIVTDRLIWNQDNLSVCIVWNTSYFYESFLKWWKLPKAITIKYISEWLLFNAKWIFHSNISLKASSWSLTWDTMRSLFWENMYVYQDLSRRRHAVTSIWQSGL